MFELASAILGLLHARHGPGEKISPTVYESLSPVGTERDVIQQSLWKESYVEKNIQIKTMLIKQCLL